MINELSLLYLMGLVLFIGIVLNVWLFISSDDESSNDFN